MADGVNRENIITILGSYSDVGEPIILSITKPPPFKNVC